MAAQVVRTLGRDVPQLGGLFCVLVNYRIMPELAIILQEDL